MRASQKQKKRILLLHTGGTIGMEIPTPSDPSKAPLSVSPGFVRSLFKQVPELKQLADIEIMSLFNKDSSQLTPSDWTMIAVSIRRYEDEFDGFVVTHGTDTMAYSATAVSYLLPWPYKPVVFTGSQRPLGELRTDARRNLINSVAFAASQKILEVSIFFDTVLLRGNRAMKSHIEEFHAFTSPNFPVLAQEKLRTRFYVPARENIRRPPLMPLFDGSIQVVQAFPGARVTLDKNAKAVLVLGFGCGNLPLDDSSVLKLLKAAKKAKIPVVLASQVRAGSVAAEIYDVGRRALALGAIPTGDMTFEAALVKAMILAGNNVDYEIWPELMGANWAGELTVPPS